MLKDLKIDNCNSEIKNYFTNFSFKNDYLYERKDYAKKIVNLLTTGTSISLFEIRRKGKTTFLKNDVASLASQNMFVFYYSFMRDNLNSSKEVSNDFKQSLFDFLIDCVLKQTTEIKRNENSFLSKIGFKFSFLSSGFEFNIERIKEKINFDDVKLSDLLNTINEFKDKPLLLLLDEFQELGKNPELIHFIRMLRTELDMREWIRVIFTGSSYFDLENMFSKYDSPFFKFGLKINFEDLDKNFIINCLNIFNRRIEKTNPLLKIETNNENVNKFYELYKENGSFPVYLTNIFFQMEINQNNDPSQYINDNQLISEYKILKDKWKSLNKLEKLILYRIVHQSFKSIATEEALMDYQSYFDLNENSNKDKNILTMNKINYCLKKLKEKNILFKENKQSWKIVDNSFYRFIKDLNRIE